MHDSSSFGTTGRETKWRRGADVVGSERGVSNGEKSPSRSFGFTKRSNFGVLERFARKAKAGGSGPQQCVK